MNKLAGIESARGLAAVLVVLVHSTSMLSPSKYLGELPLDGLFKFGHAGVDFFFVLSGLIIYYVHAKELGKPGFALAFWVKRIIRIFPVYWVVLAGLGLVLVFSPSPDRYERNLVAVVTNVFLIPQEHGPILGVAWSLSHEFLFYAFFSLFFFSITVARVAFIFWAVLILLNIITGWADANFVSRFVLRIFNIEFFFGMFVAYRLRNNRYSHAAKSLMFGGVVFFGAGVFESWGPTVPVEWPPLHFCYGIGAAAILYGLVALEQSGRIAVPDWAMNLGEASYSIYLVHVIVIMALQQIIFRANQIMHLPVTPVFISVVAISICVSMLFSRIVEQPLIQYFRKNFRGLLKPKSKGKLNQLSRSNP